jgi:hypothetical protein
MKPKPGTIQICSFLVSVFLYSNIFAQVSQTPEQPLSLVFFHPNAPAHKGDLTSIRGWYYTTNSVISVTDTTRKKDSDNDNIPDSLDKCPDEKGVIQYDGCPVPDSDNDGIADDTDNCPTIAGTLRNKGCPPADVDGDKINDEDDKCPAEPGVARYLGCPVGDRDSDGINDDDDKCINVRGAANNAGCPENQKNTSSGSKPSKKKL